MPPPSQFQNQQAVQQLMQGMNTMQMRQGLMPGGVQQLPPMITPPQMGPRPADVSQKLQVQFTQQQQLAQMVAPPPAMDRGMTPVRRPSPFAQGMALPSLNLPGAQFGQGRMMARQRARGMTNENFGRAQAGMGLGMRALGTGGAALLGGIAGSAMGPVGTAMGAAGGAALFEGFGGGQAMQNFGSSLMQPMIRNRQQSLQLQNQSMGFVRGGADMSSIGTGLSMQASTRLSSQLGQMAGSNQFQKDTGGRFNRQDVMKITRLAGEMGILEQSQTADQIKDSIGKISRSLSNFMKIAEEPDVKEAMRMMGQMRALGMSIGQTSTAASNARQFARMAGTSVRGVMAGGMEGAQQFQQAGLSGASGLNAGMAAQGMAGQLAGFMSPAQLAMAGGRRGISNTISGQAARAGTMDALLPGLLRRRGGRLQVDREAVMAMATGETNINQVVQRGANMLQDRRSLNELTGTRRRELQNEMQTAMGGQLSALMPLIQARAIMGSSPGTTMGQALRMQGMSEQQASTFAQMASNPEFWQNMREQQRIGLREARNDLRDRREQTRDETRTPRALRRLEQVYDRQVSQRGSSAMERAEEFFARRSDDAEEQEAAGGGRRISTLRRSRLDSNASRAAIRDLSRTRAGQATLRERQRGASLAANMGVAEEEETDSDIASLRDRGYGLGIVVAEIAETGISAYRGGESLRQVVNRGQDFRTRVRRTLGAEIPTTAQIRREASAQIRVARGFERVNTMTNNQRDANLARARQSTSGAIRSPEQFDRMVSQAGSAINMYADSQSNFTGIGEGRVTEGGMREAMRTRLLAGGSSPAEVDAFLNTPEAVQQARNMGAGSRTENAQERIDEAVNQGGESDAARTGRRERVTREQADNARSAALTRVGIDSGFLSSVSSSQQRAVLGILTGEGADVQLRREALGVRALEARARETGTDADNVRANAAAQALESKYSSEAARTALAATSGIDDATLRVIGASFEGQNVEQVNATLRGAGGRATAAGAGETSIELRRIYGRDVSEALDSGGIEGVTALLEAGGGRGMGGEARDRLLRGLQRGTVDEASMRRRAGRQADGRAESVFGGGLSTLAEKVGGAQFGDVIASLEDFATQGGNTPGSTDQRDPQNFAEAVSMFSEASTNLLAAANALSSGGDITGIGNIVNAGSPLMNMVLPPVAGNIALLGQGLRGLFGG